MEKQFLSIREFSVATGTHIKTVTNWVKDKTVMSSRLGKRILIPIEELEKLKNGGAA